MHFVPLRKAQHSWTGIAGRLGVHLFDGYVSLGDMAEMEAFGDRWHRENPGEVVELTIIFPSEARMSSEERQRMIAIIKRWEKKRRASAIVILARGLVGAAHRSVLTGLLYLAPPPHPSKVFSETRDAVDWLAPFVVGMNGPSPTAGTNGSPSVPPPSRVPSLLRGEMLTGVEELCTKFTSRAAVPVPV